MALVGTGISHLHWILGHLTFPCVDVTVLSIFAKYGTYAFVCVCVIPVDSLVHLLVCFDEYFSVCFDVYVSVCFDVYVSVFRCCV